MKNSRLIVLGLTFIVLRTLFALIWDVFVVASQPELQSPPNSSIWPNAFIGVVLGAVSAILFSTLKAQFSSLNFRQLAVSIEKFFTGIENRLKKLISDSKAWFNNLRLKIKLVSNIAIRSILIMVLVLAILVLIAPIIVILPSIKLVQLIGSAVSILIKWIEDVLSPKWCNEKGVVDSGLIGVSIAIMAAIITIPAVVETEEFDYTEFFSVVRTACLVITMFISLYLIELYAREKGYTSEYSVAISLREGGPFFWLTWLLIFGAILAIIPLWFKH